MRTPLSCSAALLFLALASTGCKSHRVSSDAVAILFEEDGRALAEATFTARRVDWQREPEICFRAAVRNGTPHDLAVHVELVVAGEGGAAFGPARFEVPGAIRSEEACVPANTRRTFGVCFDYPPGLAPKAVVEEDLELRVHLASTADVLAAASNPFAVYWQGRFATYGSGGVYFSPGTGGGGGAAPKTTYRPAPVPRRP